MDSPPDGPVDIESEGLRVAGLCGWWIASLRHFDRAGAFVAEVESWLGAPLPGPLQAISCRPPGQEAAAILAWRSPTETMMICDQEKAFAALEQRLAGSVDGSMVNQTGGFSIFQMQGRRCSELLQRIGAKTAIPGLGEARGGSAGEVRALTLSIRSGEFLMFIERSYAAHVAQWMRVSASDLC